MCHIYLKNSFCFGLLFISYWEIWAFVKNVPLKCYKFVINCVYKLEFLRKIPGFDKATIYPLLSSDELKRLAYGNYTI